MRTTAWGRGLAVLWADLKEMTMMQSNLTKKEAVAIQTKLDKYLQTMERAIKGMRHTLHELETSFPGIKPLGGGGTDKP